VCNEKRLIESAVLTGVQRLFEEVPAEPLGVRAWVDRVARALGERAGDTMPWTPVTTPVGSSDTSS
jgi:hypothetical protein